jgi:hypothetical protein
MENNDVNEIYSRIFALPPSEQKKALFEHWQVLPHVCPLDIYCFECRKEPDVRTAKRMSFKNRLQTTERKVACREHYSTKRALIRISGDGVSCPPSCRQDLMPVSA